MTRTCLLRPMLCALWLLANSEPAAPENYPTGPVRIIVPQGAGGPLDITLRMVVDHLSKLWGQQAIVVNQPGGGGAIAARALASASPDGHTLLMAPTSTFVVLPEIQTNLPFDVSNFVPIGLIGTSPMGIAVSQSLAVNSLPDLIALSQRQRGGLNVVGGQRGGIPHLTSELFRSRSGADLTIVHYPSSAQAMGDVMSGRVPVIIDGLVGPVAGGQLKLLAIASPGRLPSRPDVPTVSETISGFAASGWQVLVAPSGTTTAVVKRLSDDLTAVLLRADLNQKFAELGTFTRFMSAQELSDFIRSERQLWKPVIKQLGLVPQ